MVTPRGGKVRLSLSFVTCDMLSAASLLEEAVVVGARVVVAEVATATVAEVAEVASGMVAEVASSSDL